MHKHMTIPITVNASGKAAIVWQPYYLQETTAPAYCSFYVNNSTTLTLTTPETVGGYTPIITNFGLPANIYSSYRLVSASIKIDPQMSLQTAQGSIGGGIAVYANQAGFSSHGSPAFLFSGDLTVASNVDNLLYFNKANITEQQSIRHIFIPLDPSYEIYTPINYPHGFSASAIEVNTEFYFAYYITGAPASSSFNVELYANFECMPTPVAEGFVALASYQGGEDSTKIIKSITSHPTVITQSSPSITQLLLEEDNDFSQPQKFNSSHEKSFMNDMSAFISDNGSSLMGLAKTVMSFF